MPIVSENVASLQSYHHDDTIRCRILCARQMEPLDLDLDLDFLTQEEAITALGRLGRRGVAKLSREAAINQLRICILTRQGYPGIRIRRTERTPRAFFDYVIGVFADPHTAYTALGLPVRNVWKTRSGETVQTLYSLMLHPTAFQDLLLTLVPMMSYRADVILQTLLASAAPEIVVGLEDLVRAPPDVLTAFDMLQQMAVDHFAGAAVTIPENPPYTYEWVIDVGRSGTEYPRLMFTMPNGDIWSTGPFGMIAPVPIPLFISGLSMADLRAIAELFRGHFDTPQTGIVDHHYQTSFMNHDYELSLGLMAFLINHCGAIFEIPAGFDWTKQRIKLTDMTNLGQVFAAHGIDGLTALANQFFPSYIMRRVNMSPSVAADVIARNKITAFYEGVLPPIMRIPPEAYDPIPIWDKYGLPPPSPTFFDGAAGEPDRVQRMIDTFGGRPSMEAMPRGMAGDIRDIRGYMNVVDPRHDAHSISFVFDVWWRGGLGQTIEDAQPLNSDDLRLVKYVNPVEVATLLKLPGAAFYTTLLLTRVLKRGYIYPSVIPADAERLAEAFQKLLPVQLRMLAAATGKPIMTAQDFVTSKIGVDPIFPLIAGYDPANTEAYIDQMTLLPPSNVNRLQYVQDELPLLKFTKKTGTFNTDSELLATAGFHVPYQHYRDITPYIKSMLPTQHRFFIPFVRPAGISAGGADLADTTIFMVAYGTPTEAVWLTMRDLNTVALAGHQQHFNDLHTLLFEAIDVLYYPHLNTTYLQAIYAAFTHEDEEQADIFIERTRAAPATRVDPEDAPGDRAAWRRRDARIARGVGGLPRPDFAPPVLPALPVFAPPAALAPDAAQARLHELEQTEDGAALIRWLFNNPDENDDRALRMAIADYGRIQGW